MASPASVAAVVWEARLKGREVLYETEALMIAAAAGVGIPAYLVVPDPESIRGMDLGVLLADRVVVKALAPGLIHKSEVGGVRVVAKDAVEIAAVVAAMRSDVPEAEAFMVAEYVEHDPGPAGEMLLGMRWTAEFGPVVTFGFGGVAAEAMAALGPPRSVSVVSPLLDGPQTRRVLDGSAVVGLLTRESRSRSPAWSADGLASLVSRFVDLAEQTMPDDLAEFEINPLVVGRSGPMALDATARLGPATTAPERSPLPPGTIERVLHPHSIGIVGVSERINLGRIILHNVLAAGYPPQAVTVVKEGIEEIDGVRCVPDLKSLGRADVLVVSVSAEAVPDLLEQVAGSTSAHGVILIPGGLGERPGSEEHAARIGASLAGREAGSGPFVNGGNCMGIRSRPGRYDTTFIPEHKTTPSATLGDHPVAVVSQSGAFALSRLDRLAWLDPRYVVTVGNQIDLTVGDYLDHFADDPRIEVAACYVEGFRPGDGRRWIKAARRLIGRGGSVVLLRGGRTAAGARSAATHTAAVAGDPLVTRALAEAVGVLVADSLDEFEDLIRLAVLLRGRRVDGMRLGVVSNAGFECVAAGDALGPFTLAPLGPEAERALGGLLAGRRLDGVVGVRNPLDLTPGMDDEGFAAAAAVVLGDPRGDVGLVGCVPFTPSLDTLPAGDDGDEDLAGESSLPARLLDLWNRTERAWVAVVDGGARYDPMVQFLEEGGIPTLRSADRALRLFGRYVGSRLGWDGRR